MCHVYLAGKWTHKYFNVERDGAGDRPDRERYSVCECVCVCVRERERKR